MTDFLERHRAAAVFGVVAALLLLALLLAGRYLHEKYLWAQSRIEQTEPRYARLLGLGDSGAQLEQGLAEARRSLARLGHPPGRESAQIGNELQQVARRALQSAGLSVINSQVTPGRVEAGVERISLVAHCEGTVAALQLFLAGLQGESPTISVDALNIQSTGRTAADGSPLVSIRQTLTVLRVAS